MSSILQGTTPSLKIKINTEDFLVGDVVKLEFGIFHNGRQSLYGLNDVDIDTEENSFTYHFTEEQTLGLNPNKSIVYQLRFYFSDSNIVGTTKMILSVDDLCSREVMSG